MPDRMVKSGTVTVTRGQTDRPTQLARPPGHRASILHDPSGAFRLERLTAVPLLQVTPRMFWLARGGIHHDTVQPGRDRGIAVNAGGAVGLFPEDVCVSNVPSGLFDHVDVDPP